MIALYPAINLREHSGDPVILLHQGKRRLANLIPIILDHFGTDSIYGPKLQTTAKSVSKIQAEPLLHIVGGSCRIRQRQNIFGSDPGTINHIAESCYQHGRLAASGNRQQKNRPVYGADRFYLLFVEPDMKFTVEFFVCHLYLYSEASQILSVFSYGFAVIRPLPCTASYNRQWRISRLSSSLLPGISAHNPVFRSVPKPSGILLPDQRFAHT